MGRTTSTTPCRVTRTPAWQAGRLVEASLPHLGQPSFPRTRVGRLFTSRWRALHVARPTLGPMPSLAEIHGLLAPLPLLAVPVLALLVVLERLGRGGDLPRRTQPWVLAAGASGAVVAVGSGLLV